MQSPEAAKAAPKRTRQSRKRQAVPVPAAEPDVAVSDNYHDAGSQEAQAAEEKCFFVDQ